MADDDVDVTLRLRAIDDTGRVLDDASRRTQAFLNQFNQGLKASAAATTALTAAMKTTGQAVQQAASTTAQHTTAVTQHTAAANRAASATQAHAKAVHEHSKAMEVAHEVALRYFGGLMTVAGVLDTVTKGFEKFAESQRSMERIQIDTEATSTSMEHLGETIHKLAATTGQSGTVLRESFSAFREQTELAIGDADKLFERIVLSSHAAGTSVEGMTRIATAALLNLKVPQEELSGMLDTMVKTIPASMMDTYAQMMPRITQDLHLVGVEGKQAAVDLGVAFTTIATSLGGNARQAVMTLQDIFHKAYDISSPLGQQVIPLVQQYVGTPEQVQKTMEASYEVIKRYGFFNTKDLGVRSSILQELGIDARSTEALDAFNKKMEENRRISERTQVALGEVNLRNSKFAGDAKTQLDRMSESTNNLYTNVGKLFETTGAAKLWADTLEFGARMLKETNREQQRANAYKILDEGFASPKEKERAERTLKIMDLQDTQARQERDAGTDRTKMMMDKDAEQRRDAEQIAEQLRLEQQLLKTYKEQQVEKEALAQGDKYFGPPAPSPKVPANKDELLRMYNFDPVTGEKLKGDQADTATGHKLESHDPVRVIPVAPGAGAGTGLTHHATGGEFTVPGSGRGDEQPVGFMATPGERVKVESIPEADKKESLQKQQDKADLALQEHFARFRPKLRPGAQLGSDWPHDRLPGSGGMSGGAGGGGGTGGGQAGGVRGAPGGPSGASHVGAGEWTPGGSARLSDQKGNLIDAGTMSKAEELGKLGDAEGLKKLFAQKGYHMDGPACGIVASKYSLSAGFAPPEGGAVASNWHKWGQSLKPEDINAPEHPFGSMFATYGHRRYGGNVGAPLPTGATGGHVMSIVPGSYNPKTGEIGVVDQYGYGKRKLTDLDLRFAGADAVAEVKAKRAAEAGTAPAAGATPAVGAGAKPAAGGVDLSKFVKGKESFKAHPFQDVGGVNIGYGTRARPGETTITEEEASRRMNAELDADRAKIEKLNPNLSEGSKKALTSLLYNLGGDVNKLKHHGMAAAIAANDVEAMKKAHVEFSHIHGPQGPVLRGLRTRREEEASFYDEKNAPAAAPAAAAPAAAAPAAAAPAPAGGRTSSSVDIGAARKRAQQTLKGASSSGGVHPSAAKGGVFEHGTAAVSHLKKDSGASFDERFKAAGDSIESDKPDPMDAAKKRARELYDEMSKPIEPVIRPRIQHTGPLSMRWTRQSERQRSRDINRDQARAAPTDQGFA